MKTAVSYSPSSFDGDTGKPWRRGAHAHLHLFVVVGYDELLEGCARRSRAWCFCRTLVLQRG